MNLSYEKNMILNLLERNPDMGKTAVMKTLFFLKEVKKINLNYDFSIYTYGPYSADVSEDVDELISEGSITSTMYPYQNYIGYELNVSEKVKSNIEHLDDIGTRAITEILSFIHGKSAKDLELYSTIIYINNLYLKNTWKKDAQSIVRKVKEIKPHFSEEIITEAYKTLKVQDYIAG